MMWTQRSRRLTRGSGNSAVIDGRYDVKEKLILIGAGSAMFTRGLISDVIRQRWEGEIALVDTDPQALSVVDHLARKMVKAGRSPLRISGSSDRRQVLKDATAVICTVGVGGRRAWEQDVFIPRKYGIHQPVGDTVMPGGTSRAMRMVPAMVAIAQDVLDLAPKALFFNYGNPMSVICRGVRKATGAEIVGLCHGVFHVGNQLAQLLKVPADQFRYTAVGINHLTWFTELRANGRNAKPELQKLACAQPPPDTDPFTWRLFELCGAYPAVGDRHITEFFGRMFSAQGTYYGKTLGVDAFSFEKTIAYGDRIFAEMSEVALSSKPLGEDFLARQSGEHEQVTEIIESIRTDAQRVYSVNLPNRGQVPNLPDDAVIECPAVADAAGLRPIILPPMDSFLAGTLASRFQWVETTVEAALEGSRRKFIQALLIDGAVDSIDTATRLADELLQAHAAHLPQVKEIR